MLKKESERYFACLYETFIASLKANDRRSIVSLVFTWGA